MKLLLNLIAILLVLLVLTKLAIWLQADIPIGRKSILYLIGMSIVLLMRKKWTYFLAVLFWCAPILSRLIYYNWSGSTSFDFTSNLYHVLYDTTPSVAKVFLHFPLYFSFFMLGLFLLPRTRKEYGFGKSQ